MGNSYVRQSTVTNDKSLDVEFDALENVFDSTSGHSHDGTVGEGPQIDLTSGVTGILPAVNLLEGAGGTAGTGVTSTEHGASHHHQTHLEFTNLVLPDAGDNVSKAVGVLLYTLPAGAQLVIGAQINVAVTIDDAIQTDTPDIGLGTTIATGAVALLSTTAAFENLLTGQTLGDVAGTELTKTAISALVVESGDDKTVYLNLADGWADTTTQGLTVTGTVRIDWSNFDLE